MDKKRFIIPNKDNWLADIEYLNFNHLFILYKNIYYSLKKEYLAQ